MKSSDQFSFAIITNTIRRDSVLVEKSIRASLAQPSVSQVTLIDQNRVPLTLAEDLRSNLKLVVVHAEVPSVSRARNLAPYPNVEWLIFCDDDGYMAADYISSFNQVVQSNPNVEVISGSIKRTDTGEFYSVRHAVGGDMSRFWNTKLLMGSNFAVRREVFEELGKFDDRFGAGARYGSSEETDFAWNAFFHFKRMIYAPELVVFHVPPFSGKFSDEIKKAFRYGRGKSALVRKWLFRGKISALFELFEMLIVPLLRSVQYLLTFKPKELGVQVSAWFGRLIGFFI